MPACGRVAPRAVRQADGAYGASMLKRGKGAVNRGKAWMIGHPTSHLEGAKRTRRLFNHSENILSQRGKLFHDSIIIRANYSH